MTDKIQKNIATIILFIFSGLYLISFLIVFSLAQNTHSHNPNEASGLISNGMSIMLIAFGLLACSAVFLITSVLFFRNVSKPKVFGNISAAILISSGLFLLVMLLPVTTILGTCYLLFGVYLLHFLNFKQNKLA